MQQQSPSKQQKIWQTVLQIPAGKIASYGQIADLAGLPGRARLVGKTLGLAPDELQLPWYRVMRSGGKPSGSDTEQQARLVRVCFFWQTFGVTH